jgi:hypothetical protein
METGIAELVTKLWTCGRAVAQMISRQLPTTVAQVQAQSGHVMWDL